MPLPVYLKINVQQEMLIKLVTATALLSVLALRLPTIPILHLWELLFLLAKTAMEILCFYGHVLLMNVLNIHFFRAQVMETALNAVMGNIN